MNKFKQIGFLSDELAEWSKQTRKEFKEHFALTENINRLAMKILFDLPAEEMSNAHVVANLCFGRALQSFQCSILLAERGALADTRALIRTCAETVIALSGLKEDPKMPEIMAEGHDRHLSGLVNSMLERNAKTNHLDADQIVQYESIKKHLRSKYGDRQPQDIRWGAVAAKGKTVDLYNSVYRLTSGDGAHPTIKSLDRYLIAPMDSEDAGFKFHPDKSDTQSALLLAASVMLQALGLVVDWFQLESHNAQLTNCIDQYNRLPE